MAFVGNRVAEITEAIPVACWHHVKGSDNPADSASRGMFPSELVGHALWREGPEWLKDAEDSWNMRESFEQHPIPSEERDIQRTILPVILSDVLLLERVSSLHHLLRTTAWVLRFINNARQREEGNIGLVLSLLEIQQAEKLWWRIAQRSAFPEELDNLENGKEISRRSKVLPFHPFLDEQGLLRVGGRLQKAEMSFSERHPVLLPGNHKISKLIIRRRAFAPLTRWTYLDVRLIISSIFQLRR